MTLKELLMIWIGDRWRNGDVISVADAERLSAQTLKLAEALETVSRANEHVRDGVFIDAGHKDRAEQALKEFREFLTEAK